MRRTSLYMKVGGDKTTQRAMFGTETGQKKNGKIKGKANEEQRRGSGSCLGRGRTDISHYGGKWRSRGREKRTAVRGRPISLCTRPRCKLWPSPVLLLLAAAWVRRQRRLPMKRPGAKQGRLHTAKRKRLRAKAVPGQAAARLHRKRARERKTEGKTEPRQHKHRSTHEAVPGS